MVYVDKNGQKYEYQYCVVLTEGKDAGLKHYVWASEEQILDARSFLKRKCNVISLFDSDVEVGFKKHNDIVACFDEEKIGSLKFLVCSEDLGNLAVKGTRLPLPFPNKS